MATSRLDEVLREVESRRLSQGLAKALRWAEAIGDGELARWVRLESLGYWDSNPVMSQDVVVPDYRTVAGQWFDAYGRALVLSDPQLAFINETRLRSGVAELEGFVGAAGTLAVPIPGHSKIIGEQLGVEVSTFRFSPQAVAPVLASIKAHLVDRLVQRGGVEPEGLLPAVTEDILELRPNLWGVGINLRALWRRWRSESGDD